MKRLTRPCEDTENGKYIPYTVGVYTGIFPDCTLGEVVERLAYYEDMKEQGRLVIYDEETMLAMARANAKAEEDRLELLRIINRLAAQQSTVEVNV